MKRLPQVIFLFIATVLLIVMSQSDLLIFKSVRDGLTYTFSCSGLYDDANNVVLSRAPWALMVLAIISSLLALFGTLLAFFQNYMLQKRIIIFNMVVLIGIMVTFWFFYSRFTAAIEPMAIRYLKWIVSAPLIAFILHGMALAAICRTEAKTLRDAVSFRIRD